MTTRTRIEHLRALDSDLERGRMALAWAEQERQQYYLGQAEYVQRAVERLRVRHPSDIELKVATTQGQINWSQTTTCADIKSNEQMYTRWADTYFLAHTASKA